MRLLLLITALLFAGATHAEVGSRFEGEPLTVEELREQCREGAWLTARLYELRNMLPADLEQERALEIMERLVASGKLAGIADEAPDSVPEEEREMLRQAFADPEFLEVWLYATEYVWMHSHQDDYGMTDEEKAQDLIEFHEDVVWHCESEIRTANQ